MLVILNKMVMLIYNTYNPYTISSQIAQQSNISQLLQATRKIILILMCLIMQYNNFQILTTDKVQMLHFKFLKFKLIKIHKIIMSKSMDQIIKLLLFH